ncbi:MAG: hypothetical protein MK052_06355 [Alphaproteobacteria bacterium]|nr:hypothetical protein [Alphaproteobacteria bacterium]
MTYFVKIEDIPQDYHEHLDGMALTDEEKIQLTNNLHNIVHYFMDKAFGTGQFSDKDYDPAEWREKQKKRHEENDKKTPEQFYKEGYDYWKTKYWNYFEKMHGAEAAEARCAEHAQKWMERSLETRKKWLEFKKKLSTVSPNKKAGKK